MMQDGKTGFLVEEGNSDDLIEKLSILLKDSNLSRNMGKEGRQFVINNFSWEIIAKKFLENITPYLKK